MSIIATYIVPHPPLIVPEVGGGQEKRIQNTIDAYEKIAREIGEIQPDTIIVTTPHSIIYSDYIHISPGKEAKGDLTAYGDRKTKIKADYDQEFVSLLSQYANENKISAGTLGEKNKKLDHGTLIPLYFVDKYFKDYKLVRTAVSGLSSLDHYNFGKLIGEVSGELKRKTVIIASGDLSHRLLEEGPYSYAPEGPIFDEKVTNIMASGEFIEFFNFTDEDCDAAGECGLRSFIVMAGTLDGVSVESKLLSYEGPFGVGYAVASFKPIGKDESRRFDLKFQEENKKEIAKIREAEGDLVGLAREALENYVKSRKYIKLDDQISEEFTKKQAGIFVTIKKEGKLRGCIGTINPTKANLGEEIIRNAVSAGTGDPRFDPVKEHELEDLVYSVDVLGQSEPIKSFDELDVSRYGVIVTKGHKKGLLLPNIEGINKVEDQVEIALRKAGISPEDKYKMERFEVVRHK